jgi:hypothetical protein
MRWNISMMCEGRQESVVALSKIAPLDIRIPSQSRSRPVIALREVERESVSLRNARSSIAALTQFSLLDVDRGVLSGGRIAVGCCTKKEGRGARLAPHINQRLGSSARTPPPYLLLPHESIVSLLLPLRVSILDLEALFVLSISCQCWFFHSIRASERSDNQLRSVAFSLFPASEWRSCESRESRVRISSIGIKDKRSFHRIATLTTVSKRPAQHRSILASPPSACRCRPRQGPRVEQE